MPGPFATAWSSGLTLGTSGSPSDLDPGPDPERILREIRESRPRFGCLGCFVEGGWAVAVVVGLVVLIVYVIGHLT